MMEEDQKSAEKLKLKLKFTFKQQDQEKKQQQQQEVNELVEHPDHHASLEKKEGGDGVEAAEVNTNNGDEGESSSALVVSKARFCHICGREFINGKALGGHMRVHQQQQQEEGRPRRGGSGLNPAPAQGDHQDQVHACTHCHKEFPSAKALFGHMRSHPERDYRGMQPPSGSSRSPDRSPSDPGHGSGSGSGQHACSEPQSDSWLPGWRNTRKRGSTGHQAALSESEARRARIKAYLYSTDDSQEAAAELVALANGQAGGAAAKRRRLKKRGEYDEIDEYYLTNEVELSVESSLISYNPLPPRRRFPLDLDDPNKPLEDHAVSKLKSVGLKIKNKKKYDGKKKAKKTFNNLMASVKADDGDNNKNEHDDNGDDDDGGHDGDDYDEGHKKYYGHHVHDDYDDEEGEENEGVKKKWKCSTCNKTFPTHQALGGHRSSHNKDKQQSPQVKMPNPNYPPLTLTRTQIEPGSGLTHVGPGCDDRENGSGSGSGSGTASSENLVFKCKTCGESFPTEQALGGHQRCHYSTPPPSSESSPEQRTGSPAERRVLEIDLNLIAEEEEEEVVEDGGVENSTTR